mmetsp:Transcript_25272/g.69501  ORF Transcript_25272/g.69501 Transcript_25272/m.69501 type:complete len:216 (-) Transcript_25272:17-664(-)
MPLSCSRCWRMALISSCRLVLSCLTLSSFFICTSSLFTSVLQDPGRSCESAWEPPLLPTPMLRSPPSPAVPLDSKATEPSERPLSVDAPEHCWTDRTLWLVGRAVTSSSCGLPVLPASEPSAVDACCEESCRAERGGLSPTLVAYARRAVATSFSRRCSRLFSSSSRLVVTSMSWCMSSTAPAVAATIAGAACCTGRDHAPREHAAPRSQPPAAP